MTDRLTTQAHWDKCYDYSLPTPQRTYLRRFARTVLLRKRRRLLRQLIDSAGDSQARVLELGCAPGVMIEQMQETRPDHEYHGLDYSETGLRKTTENLRRRGRGATLYHADLTTVTPPLLFDLVVSFGLVEHFENPANAIGHHVRFCHPGGHVAVTVPNFASRIPRWIHTVNDPANLNIHNLSIMNRGAMSAALEAAGLERIVVGTSGGPALHPAAPGKFYETAYRRLAIAWNIFWQLSPIDLFWRSQIWGIGRVPNG